MSRDCESVLAGEKSLALAASICERPASSWMWFGDKSDSWRVSAARLVSTD